MLLSGAGAQRERATPRLQRKPPVVTASKLELRTLEVKNLKVKSLRVGTLKVSNLVPGIKKVPFLR